jgi:hypothetical protein
MTLQQDLQQSGDHLVQLINFGTLQNIESDEEGEKRKIVKSELHPNNNQWEDQIFSELEPAATEPGSPSKDRKTIYDVVQGAGENFVSGLKKFAISTNTNNTEQEDVEGEFDCNKERYLKKYGLKFNIPSLSVLSSAWYPSDPQYFVQIVSFKVPEEDEFEVQTHYLEEGKDKWVSNFQEIFKDRINGCTIRLIKTSDNLDSIKVIDSYVYNLEDSPIDLDNMEDCNYKKVKIAFSVDGRYFVIYSNFVKVFKF